MDTFQVKEIKDISIAYVVKTGSPALVAGKAFWELEKIVSLNGNKFLGVYDEAKNEYKACVEINEQNQEAIKDLAHGIIQGGKYAYVKIVGEYNKIVREIRPAFDALIKNYNRDMNRLPVEFYKRHTEVIVMLPIIS